MKKVTLGYVLALALPVVALATTTEVTETTLPPTDLKKIGDHWTPWDPPTPPEGAQVYVIEKGDTLWDLAERDLSDPFLWPQIWDLNRYILDSHWIYPGDPLIMPGPVTVVAEEGFPPEVEPTDGEGETTEIAEDGTGVPVDSGEGIEAAMVEPEPSGRPRQNNWSKPDPESAADPSEMLCQGYILPDQFQSDVWVYAGEQEHKLGYGPGDVMYMNQGLSDGVRPGDKFFVVHGENKVKHPLTLDTMGYYVRRMATVQVMVAQAETATVEIVDGCDTVLLGYDLVPFEDLVSPKRRDTGLERYGVEDNGNVSGHVVYAQGPVVYGEPSRLAKGEGEITHIDLGSADGIEKGDYLMVYRDDVVGKLKGNYPAKVKRRNEAGIRRVRYKHKSALAEFNTRPRDWGKEIPRKMLGEAVVLDVQENSATVKLMGTWREVYPGDRVQVLD